MASPLDPLSVYVVMVWGLGALAMAALFFVGRHMEPEAPSTPDAPPPEVSSPNLAIADWVSAYRQAPEYQAEIMARVQRYLGVDWAQAAANLRGPTDYRIRSMEPVVLPGRITPVWEQPSYYVNPGVYGDDVGIAPQIGNELDIEPLTVPSTSDDAQSLTRTLMQRAAEQEAAALDPNALTEGVPESGHDPTLTAAMLRQAMLLLDAGSVTWDQFRQAAYQPAALTAEQRRYYELDLMNRITGRAPVASPEEQERRRRESEARQAARQAARVRAEGLLLEKLTPEQQETWKTKQYVEVTGSATGYTYRVKRGVSLNIDCVQAGYTYCAAPANAHETPVEDVILAQVLWLGCDEKGFLAKANRQPMASFWATAEPAYLPNLMLHWTEAAPRPGREDAEAWMPDCCVSRGCALELTRETHPLRPMIRIRHQDAGVTDPSQATHLASLVTPRQQWESRQIRRYLEAHLHRNEPAPGPPENPPSSSDNTGEAP